MQQIFRRKFIRKPERESTGNPARIEREPVRIFVAFPVDAPPAPCHIQAVPATSQARNLPTNGPLDVRAARSQMNVTPKASRVSASAPKGVPSANKAPKAPKLTLTGPDRLVSLGNQGTAFCLSLPPDGFPCDGSPMVASYRGFKACGVDPRDIGELHANGEACGLPEWDACLFTAERGTATQVLPLSVALAKGLVAAHRVILVRDGVRREATVYGLADWSPAKRQPRILATDALPAGRVENHLVAIDKRNAGYVGRILPLAFAKASAKPALATVATVKPTVAPATTPAKRKVPATPATPAKGKNK